MNVRRAYTLMELLLVLAIIVIAAAAVAPSFRGVIRSASLKSAASDVRAALTKAHVMAMKTGRTQVFQFELDGSKYKTEPYIAGDDELESVEGDPSSPLAAAPTAQNSTPEKQLPEGIKFTAGDTALESRSERIEREISGTSSGANWSRPILFFADGSTLDAFVVVGNEHNAGIRIDLRGMTSAVKVSDVSNLKSLEDPIPLSR